MRSWFGNLALAVLLATGSTAWGQAPESWPDPGPPATRDMFPLNLIPLTYRPLGARPLGQGKTLLSLQFSRANTFEFSELIKELLLRDPQGRLHVDPASAKAFAAAYPDEALVYFFDAEVVRTELNFKYGATPRTDVSLRLSWQGISGGFLDGPIEAFHKLGFEQAGRAGIVKNQIALLVVQKGQVVMLSQDSVVAHAEDPLVTVLHRLHESPKLTLSLAGILQLPLTRWRNAYQSNWDSSASLLLQWRPSQRQVVDAGFAYLRRGLQQSGPAPFFIKDQLAGHLGWEWRGWRGARPYLLLVGTSGLAAPGPGAKLDKPSLLHDLGVHVRLSSTTALTLSYLNNITHNENTADMAVALRLTVRP